MDVRPWQHFIFHALISGVKFNAILVNGEPLRMVQQPTWSGRERSSHSCLELVPKSGSPPSIQAFTPISRSRLKSGTLLLALVLFTLYRISPT